MIAPNACFLGTAPAISDESRGGCLRRVAGHRPRRLRRGHRHGATDLLDVDDATTPSTSSTWPTCSTGTTGARGAWDEVRTSPIAPTLRRLAFIVVDAYQARNALDLFEAHDALDRVDGDDGARTAPASTRAWRWARRMCPPRAVRRKSRPSWRDQTDQY
jgi:hypothetical protein